MAAIVSFIFFLALCIGAASSGALFQPGEWYQGLQKPGWTPPNWAFPLVWAALFLMIAIAGWLIWQKAGWSAAPVLGLYVVHLIVNAAWSFLFFGQRRLDWAMGDVILLWAMIVAMIFLFSQISVIAALLLVPYLIWVTIAASLNFRLLQLNGRHGGWH